MYVTKQITGKHY